MPITLAQIELPVGLVNLGEVAIIAAALLGVVYAIKPLISGYLSTQKELATVNRELRDYLQQSNRVIDHNADEIKDMRGALQAQTEALTQLVKVQSDTLVQLRTVNEAQATRTIETLTATLNSREATMEAGIARIEAAVAALKDEILSGSKAHRVEMTAKVNDILRAIDSLKPPPPPVLIKHPEPLEREKTA
jgi:phage-related minor tail protein